jgi:hypothetical protein
VGKRGRPKSQKATGAYIVRLNLRLYRGEDGDLISFFEGIPLGLRAARTKVALREGLTGQVQQSDDQGTLFDALDALVDQ